MTDDLKSRRDRAGVQYGLTPTEHELLAAVVGGKTNREIAERLDVSAATVKHHLESIFDKLRVYNRVELVLFALDRELVGQENAPVPNTDRKQFRAEGEEHPR